MTKETKNYFIKARISASERQKINECAETQKITVSKLIRLAIEKYIAEAAAKGK